MSVDKRTRKVRIGQQCSAQDKNGKRCRALAVIETDYHGDPEIYCGTDRLSWVRVELCQKHAEALRA